MSRPEFPEHDRIPVQIHRPVRNTDSTTQEPDPQGRQIQMDRNRGMCFPNTESSNHQWTEDGIPQTQVADNSQHRSKLQWRVIRQSISTL